MLLNRFFVVLIFLFWIRFVVDSGLLLALVKEVLKEISKFHFHKHRALTAVLTMAVADCKEMLMVCLAYVWCKYEIILVFLIHIVNAEALPGRISKSCYHIVFYDFQSFLLVLPHLEWVFFVVLNPIVIIDALI